MKNLAANQELFDEVMGIIGPEIERFRSDRIDKVDPLYEVADAMFVGMISRTLDEQEREKGVNTSWDTRAHVGSTAYNRFCMQLAAALTRICNSERLPFRYIPVANSEVWLSDADGAMQAAQYNAVAQWVWQQDRMPERIHGIFIALAKYSNLPLVIEMKNEVRRVARVDPKTKKVSYASATASWPSVKMASWEALLGDYYGGDVRDQKIVCFETIVPFHSLASQAKQWDKEQWEKFKEDEQQYKWDASTAAEPKADREENKDGDYSPKGDGKYLRRDIYAWLPIKGDKYDEQEDQTLWWITTVGNNAQSSLCLRFSTDFDPDGEIPGIMLHARPDDEDKLYHVTNAELSRSLYSVWCSLIAMLCDNVANRNDPRRLVNTDMFDTENMDDEAIWKCHGDVDKAVREFAPGDTTPQILPALSAISREWMQVMNVTDNDFGLPMGGRTTATENMNVQNQAREPVLFAMSYILYQFLYWYARKVKSYIECFMRTDQVVAISDAAGKMVSVQLKDLYGDFDIDVFVVGEYANNELLARTGMQLLNIVGQSPALAKSQTHSVDIGELLRSTATWLRMPTPSRFIRPALGADAKARQQDEIEQMLASGQYIQPQPDEDHESHIQIVEGEMLKWAPLAGTPEYDAFIGGMLIPHRDAHKQMQGQASMMSSVQAGGGTLPTQPNVATAGQAVGQVEGGPAAGGAMM